LGWRPGLQHAAAMGDGCRAAVRYARLPGRSLRAGQEFALLREASIRKVYNLVHLIYRSKQYEGDSKDYEFSRLSMQDHWRAGYNDTVRTLRHPAVLERPQNEEGFVTFDLSRDGSD